MAHGLEKRNGRIEAAFAGKVPWHGLGTALFEHPNNLKEAMIAAGLDWNVSVESAYDKDGNNLDNFCKLFKRDTDKSTLGVVGPDTYPLQNSEAFDFFQPFLDAGEAKLETAGSLDNGRKVWVMASLNKEPIKLTKKDTIFKNLLLSNAHGENISIRVGFCPINVVCWNTLQAAHKQGKLLRLIHSKSARANLEKIRETINLANQEFETTAEGYQLLARSGVNRQDLEKYVKTVMKMAENPETGKLKTRTQNVLDNILDRYDQEVSLLSKILAKEREPIGPPVSQKDNEVTLSSILDNFESTQGRNDNGAKGSWFDAYQAVNSYLNHERGHRPETRLNSLWFGQSRATDEYALQLALDAASGNVNFAPEVEATSSNLVTVPVA